MITTEDIAAGSWILAETSLMVAITDETGDTSYRVKDLLQGRDERQRRLKETLGFDCRCDDCEEGNDNEREEMRRIYATRLEEYKALPGISKLKEKLAATTKMIMQARKLDELDAKSLLLRKMYQESVSLPGRRSKRFMEGTLRSLIEGFHRRVIAAY